MLLRKKRGKFFSYFLLSFFKKNNIILICHANDMHLTLLLPLRKQFKAIGCRLKFLKKKPILRVFDEHKVFNTNQKLLNGSLFIVYPINQNDFNVNAMNLLKNQENISFLGCFWNDFYSSFYTLRVLQKIKVATTTNIYQLSNEYKLFEFKNLKFKYYKSLKTLNNLKFFLLLHRFLDLKKN